MLRAEEYRLGRTELQVHSILIHTIYDLVCPLSFQTAAKRIEALFTSRGVIYKTTNLAMTSVKIPIIFLGLQPRLYSRSNWVGINPFAFVSGVDLRFTEEETGLTKITVRVNQSRGALWVAFWMACSFFAAVAMPEPAGVILFLGVTCSAWLGMVSFFGGYLIKKEIGDYLSACVSDPE